jgi:hypothetical protein
MRMPSHIKISRHGIYYFRIVIPKRLRLYFCGKLEIKKSLKTTVWRSARMQARLLVLNCTHNWWVNYQCNSTRHPHGVAKVGFKVQDGYK